MTREDEEEDEYCAVCGDSEFDEDDKETELEDPMEGDRPLV